MKYIIVVIIIIVLFILTNTSIYFHLIYNSNNVNRHKNSDSLYAHFSMIDKYNYFYFPKLLFTHPIHFKLKDGKSLYIPKKWWHWV